ncbi:MAG: hypothetical protein MPW16_05185 [Candidatus Manganitrophus sp.]|nr:MAG: hypothetical protein MPW16_05185 [Candidatus Manganitrophus sp.]
MAGRTRETPIQSNYGVWASRQSAEFLLREMESESYRHFLAPSFIAALCAGIEGEINTCYVDFFHKKLGKKYRPYIRPYLMLRVEDRLTQLPLLLSNFKYGLNDKNPKVKQVLQLFERRNQLLHVKHLWHYADITEDEKGKIIAIKYHDENDRDPYRDSTTEFVEKSDLRTYMKLYNEFIPRFASLASRITRKNFNPHGWFVRVEL